MRMLVRIALVAIVGACGGSAAFRLTSNDNDRNALAAALAKRQLPEQPTPQNAARQPRVFVLEAGAPKTIVAYDLAAGALLWKVDADVQSRIWVGGNFIVALEAKQLVARDQRTGAVMWKVGISGDLVGAAAD